ncbi:hypothetical protein [Bradyrhizobium sp. BR 10289]|uniref:hypothetical protein n=1 Tax=Bradyrhizobium sp. BR 10289 TaxID=2749993 RepID=UPI001C651FCB|nr:hypothetical protein [Bradyrhizobium sp. BR 10289]MBW7971570.1 hypothetical protein [Bradyrhizobium sp. BR 10289]
MSTLNLPRLQLQQDQRDRAPQIDVFKIFVILAAFGFGFFLQFNIVTSTFGLPFLRISDALLFLLLPFFFIQVGLTKMLKHGILYFAVFLAIGAVCMMLKTAIGDGDRYFTLIFLLTSIFAYLFVYAAEDEEVLIAFAVGTVLGLIPSLVVLFLQGMGNTSLPNIGLGIRAEDLPESSSMLSKVKLGGIWTAGNESGHVYAVAAASALYLTLRFRRPLIYITTYAALLASFTFSLNRSGLIAPTIALIYVYVRLGDYFLYLKTALILLATLVVLLLSTNALSGIDTFYDSFESRFLADDYAESNISERLMSNIEGVKVAVQNPFGIGYRERIGIMLEHTTNGVKSIHNGFLSLAYQCSLFASLLYVISGIYLLIHRRTISPFYFVTFLFATTSMFFEELSINQVFIFSVAVTMAAAWLHYSKLSETTSRGQNRPVLRRFELRKRSS